jgi:hypothetical protein
LGNLEKYEAMGYPLNLPQGLTFESSIVEIENAVRKEYSEREEYYRDYSETLQRIWDVISNGELPDKKPVLPEMKKLYGVNTPFDLKVVPTAYGTGGGALEKGGEVYFKIPKFSPRGQRSEAEEYYGMVHEVLCHEATADLRKNSPIRESSAIENPQYQFYKERLMDLIGRTLLVRSGLLKSDEVYMDTGLPENVVEIIDRIYYLDPENPDENKINYDGNFEGLISRISSEIKNPIFDLENVGSEKPIGYLPLDTIVEYGSSIVNEQKKAREKGQKTLLLDKKETDIAGGVMYVYDDTVLGKRLAENKELLTQNNFPTTPEEFIKHLGSNTVETKTKMFDFIADCFNDKTNPGRTDVKNPN